MKYEFNGNFSVVAKQQGHATIEDLEKEQGMYSATPGFVREYGGPISNRLLDLVPDAYLAEAEEKGLYPNIDIRIHRLYPKSFPAFPGWHCDAQFRETFFGQPRSEQTSLSNHLICTISSDPDGICNTEFINEDMDLAIDNYDPDEGEAFWALVDKELRGRTDFKTWLMPDGQMTQFDCWTLHRALPATKRGWRLFFRVAMWYRPNLGDGKFSRQEVIYMDTNRPTGW